MKFATILAWAALLASHASAQLAPNASFQVAATITDGCLINNSEPTSQIVLDSLGTLDFGTVSSLSRSVQTAFLMTSNSLSLRCTPGLGLSMHIDGGLNQADGSRHVRRNTDGAEIRYSLYRDAAYQHAFGINTAITIEPAAGSDLLLPVYGQLTIPPGRHAGIYTDRLTVTLEW